LLQGLSIWQKIKLSQLLDEGAKILVERSKTNSHNELLAGLVLPAISRKFRNLSTFFLVEKLINQIETELPTLQNRLDKLKELLPITWEKYEQELETEFLTELFNSNEK
jgi:hypothetical protein